MGLRTKYSLILHFYFARNIRSYMKKRPNNHDCILFNDYLYYDCDDEFLKRSYKIHEVADRIKLLAGNYALIQLISKETGHCHTKHLSSLTTRFEPSWKRGLNVATSKRRESRRSTKDSDSREMENSLSQLPRNSCRLLKVPSDKMKIAASNLSFTTSIREIAAKSVIRKQSKWLITTTFRSLWLYLF